MNDTFTNWRKSSRSASSGNCVEVGIAAEGTVGVRDTKQHGHGPVLGLTPGAWTAFVAGVKKDELHRSGDRGNSPS